ncbi:MAG: biopolymer transporter ExbD [Bacteroidota bacterium]
MAQLNPTENIAHKKRGTKQKKVNPSIDMTPMVDLGFLLICFFVFTTTMSRPNVTDLFLPKDGPPIPIKESTSLTVLLSKENKLFCYDGNWDDAVKGNRIISTNYSVTDGLGDIIRQKQKFMNEKKGKDGRNSLMLIIKATKEANYKNLMDVLDEILINDVRHYAVIDLSTEESIYLAR